MKCSQYNVKIFEVRLDDPETFIQFLEANRILLSQHLISIMGEENEEVIKYLNENSLHYVFNMNLPKPQKGVQNFKMVISEEEEAQLPVEAKEIIDKMEESKNISEDIDSAEFDENYEDLDETIPPLKIVKQPLRSGQAVEYDGSVLLTERINSGAKVAALGSVIALGPVEGDISSVGDCVIIPPLRRGTLLFHGHKIENEMLIYHLNKVVFSGDEILIQPINKKEFH